MVPDPRFVQFCIVGIAVAVFVDSSQYLLAFRPGTSRQFNPFLPEILGPLLMPAMHLSKRFHMEKPATAFAPNASNSTALASKPAKPATTAVPASVVGTRRKIPTVTALWRLKSLSKSVRMPLTSPNPKKLVLAALARITDVYGNIASAFEPAWPVHPNAPAETARMSKGL